MVQPYSSTDTATASKNSHLISSEGLDFEMVDHISIAVDTLSLYKLHHSDKTEFMCFYQDGSAISLNGKTLKLIDWLIHFSNNMTHNYCKMSH